MRVGSVVLHHNSNPMHQTQSLGRNLFNNVSLLRVLASTPVVFCEKENANSTRWLVDHCPTECSVLACPVESSILLV